MENNLCDAYQSALHIDYLHDIPGTVKNKNSVEGMAHFFW
jgi:hypothetical protein